MSRPLRLAIVGLGMAATPHAQSLIDLDDKVEVAAVYSPSPERRKAFSGTWGFPAVDDPAAIFEDRSIAAVLLLTPPSSHLELTERAAAAGKHILLEKPLEVSLARSRQVVAAAEAAGVTLAVVFQHRFRPVCEALASIIAQGRLGRIVSASARVGNWRPQSYYDQPGRGTKARDGGGVLLTQAIHTLDVLISLAGPPLEVSAYAATSPVHRMETEDLAMAAIRFADGAIGTIAATTCAYPGYPDEIEVIATAGTARIVGGQLAVRFHDGSSFNEDDGNGGSGTGADPMAFPHHYHRAVIADFLDAVATGRLARASGREALKVHALIAALLASAQQGSPQHVA